MKAQDLPGALLEYEAALSIKKDAAVQEKLAKVVVPKEWSSIASTKPKPAQKLSQEWTDFMANLERSIKSHWSPPRTNSSKQAQVTFKVDTQGQVSELKLTKSTGSPAGDQAALKAVRDAAPFSTLPSGSPPSAAIQFTFSYNVANVGAQDEVHHLKSPIAHLDESAGPDLANALVSQADAYEHDGRHTDAEPIYIRAIKIFDSNKGGDSPKLITALTALGNLYYHAKNFPSADVEHRRVMELIEKNPNHTQLELAEAQYHLGCDLANEGKSTEAISLLKSALAVQSGQGNEKPDPDLINMLGNAYFQNSQPGEALPLYQSVLQIAQKTPGIDSDVLRQRIEDVADCFYDLDRDQEALVLYEKTPAAFEEVIQI